MGWGRISSVGNFKHPLYLCEDDDIVEDNVSVGGGHGEHGAVRLPHQQPVLPQLGDGGGTSAVRYNRDAGLKQTRNC